MRGDGRYRDRGRREDGKMGRWEEMEGKKRPAVLKRGCLGGRPKEGKNYYYLPKTLAKLQVNAHKAVRSCSSRLGSGPERAAGNLPAGH